MNGSVDRYLDRLYSGAEESRRTGASMDGSPATLSAQLKAHLRESLGSFPVERTPLQASVLERSRQDGFILERVQYTSIDNMEVPAFVLLPAEGSGPWPAVLACHGHGRGYTEALGMSAQGEWLEEPGGHARFAVELARRGLMVIVPEVLGFGARRLAKQLEEDPYGSRHSCFMLAAHLLMHGQTLAGIRVCEAMRALDYLAQRPEADAGRIGAFGFSGGGMISSLTTALDERIRALAIAGYTNTFQGSILAMQHCLDNYIPGILNHAELPELIGLAAPRPLFVESGEEDRIFPAGSFREAVNQLRDIYRLHGAGDSFEAELFPEGHRIWGQRSFDWLSRTLYALKA